MRPSIPALSRLTGAISVLNLVGAATAESGDLIERWGRETGCECRACMSEAADWMASGRNIRWNPGTGADHRNYPPDRPADFESMELTIDIPDMNVPAFTATARLTLQPVGKPLSTLRLNAEQFDIRSVTHAGRNLDFSYDDHILTLRFEPPLPLATSATIDIAYAVSDPPDGMLWTPESPAWPGRPAQLHTQGQPETNRFWFPAHDFPNDRLTTTLDVTVPAGFMVSGNGRLETQSTTDARARFRWVQDKPHVPYLVSLIVGKFEEVDVAPAGSRIRMPVWVPPGKGPLAQQTYANTARMVELFERRFDEPYPWDRYAQIVVHNFKSSGMENTAATTMYDTAVLDEKSFQDADLDGLIAHELGHQWFGDLITCNSWEHIWLNEGFATYASALWWEEHEGRDGYLSSIYGTIRGQAASDQLQPLADGAEPRFERPGMVSRLYNHPFETFRKPANPYGKGCSILHMLRVKLGDELFFRSIAVYVDRYKFKTARTEDLRNVFEEVTGESLEQFFEQWCYRPGSVKLEVKSAWSEDARELRLDIHQRQRIDAENPAYAFNLPIHVYPRNADGTTADPIRIVVPCDTMHHERAITLDREPAFFVVDPEMSLLATLDVSCPSAWHLATLASSRTTVASRMQAAVELRDQSGPRTIGALVNVVKDAEEWFQVRQLAAESLGKLNASRELLAIMEAGVVDARVRLSVIRALAAAGGDDAVAVLAQRAADSGESYACRAAALASIGRLGTKDHLQIFLDALEVDSQHEQVREGALRGLAELDLKEGLEPAIRFTKLGWHTRLRPEAIDTVAALAHHDREKAVKAIAPLLQDREIRTLRAVGPALVEIRHKDALAALDQFIASTRHPEFRERAETWRSDLAAALAAAENNSTGRDVKRLEREIERLKRQVEGEKH